MALDRDRAYLFRMRALLLGTLVLSVALGAAGCGSGSAVQAKTTGADVASVGHHRTYSHETAETAPQGYQRGSLAPQVIAEARKDADAELQRKGYVLAENGELVVRMSSGRRVVEQEPSGSLAAAGAPADREDEGALVIDVLERSSGKVLSHGIARVALDENAVKPELVADAVTKILAPLPPSTAP